MKSPVIQRENQILAVLRYLTRHRIAAVVGARQVGKSTLARQIADRFEGHAEATISVNGVPGSLSFPDGPGYAAEAGFPSPCQSIWGLWGPVAFINTPCALANESMTWGSVKSLY